MARFKVGDLIEDRTCPIGWRVLHIMESHYKLEVLKHQKTHRMGSIVRENIEAVDEFCEYSDNHVVDRILTKYNA